MAERLRWRDIEETGGSYSICEDGTVMNNITGKTVNEWNDKDGYKIVSLWLNKKTANRRVARLVASAFIPNPLGLPEVNHIDEDKTNNTVRNLEWVTRYQNMTRGTLHERKAEKIRRAVVRIDTKTGARTEFRSIKEAADASGCVATHITDVCKHKPHCITAGGYRWEYKEA